MNCLNFENRKSYINYVSSLSYKDLILEKESILNLFKIIEKEHWRIRKYIDNEITPTLKAIIKNRNITKAYQDFKTSLLKYFDKFMKEKEFLTDILSSYSYANETHEESNKDALIKIINGTYDRLFRGDDEGLYERCCYLVNSIILDTADLMYNLYNVCLLSENELKADSTYPKVFYNKKFTFNNDFKNYAKLYLKQIHAYVMFELKMFPF